MNFFKQVRIYRIKIIEPCNNKNIFEKKLNLNFTLNDSGIGYRKFNNIIPEGTTGWVIQWIGKKYFAPDDNQAGLKDFLNRMQTADILIPYERIEGHFNVID